MKSIQGLSIYQFPGDQKVKACIITKSSCGAVIGMTQFSSPNLCVVQMTIGTKKLYIASAYVEPRDDELATLERLEAFLKATNDSHRIICGDFNGWHPLWGSETTNKRGCEIAELMIGNDMYICNQGSTPTFETVTHGRNRSSIIDITFASGSIYENINNWNVNLEACPLSQHNSIEFTLNLHNDSITKRKNTSTYLYKSDKANWAEFKTVLDLKMCHNGCLDVDISTLNAKELESFITKIISTIHEACRASMPMKNNGTQCRPIWWTEKLEKLKKDVISLHRKIHNTKRKGLAIDQLLEERQRKKKEYGDELRRTSTDNFREFCERQGKENVWSVTNRLLKDTKTNCTPSTLKVGDRHTNDEKETAKALLNYFYPDDIPDSNSAQEQLRKNCDVFPETNDDPPFIKEEVIECIQNMNPKRAPGIDNLTADICTQFSKAYPKLITEIMNRCLSLQYFPQQWKIAYVKIIPKPNKTDCTILNSFRPIGLLPVFGKLLEKLFINRIKYQATRDGKMSNRQFGFKEQLNTTAAIMNAIKTIQEAKENKQQVIAISLDIKSAFDNAWWPALLHRLRYIQCSRNIFGLISNYIENRKVTLNYGGTEVTKTMSKGCIQGSTCGPTLWNLILDELLETQLPKGCHIQAFADDVLLIAHAKDTNELEIITNQALSEIVQWGEKVKLSFSPEKTQAIAFTAKAKSTNLVMNKNLLSFVKEIKLLGVIVDTKLTFNSHIKYVANKAIKIFHKLCIYCRPTWGIQPENISIIYHQVIEPIITYAAGVWGHAVKKKSCKRLLEKTQRLFALKAIRGFRTVSTTAALALSQFMPLDLKVTEINHLENIRSTGITQYLPDDITLEKPTPPQSLLHPAHRVQIITDKLQTPEEVPNNFTQPTNIYTDGSKLENGRVGASFVVISDNKNTITKKFKLHDSCTVFQAELFAIDRACAWSLEKNIRNTKIFTDSMSAIQSICNRSSTHPIVVNIHKNIKKIKESGTVDITWIKGHAGSAGNEAADAAAKNAANLKKNFDYAKFPISFVKAKIKKDNLFKWQNRYYSAPQGKHTKGLLPDIFSIKRLWQTTKVDFKLTQILTGHGFHREYLHRFKISNTDVCPCNNHSVQNIEHLLKCCTRFGAQRMEHELCCQMLKVAPYKIQELVTKEGAITSFVNYASYIIDQLKSFNRN
ncbi:unnamed protein product [Parnassius mnemosyne]|uniref:Uncharacterized protein n=1 Tax=Parnassius mnemosyne TaxID=213953 RepID=A0AAV1MD79_9NEOP